MPTWEIPANQYRMYVGPAMAEICIWIFLGLFPCTNVFQFRLKTVAYNKMIGSHLQRKLRALLFSDTRPIEDRHGTSSTSSKTSRGDYLTTANSSVEKEISKTLISCKLGIHKPGSCWPINETLSGEHKKLFFVAGIACTLTTNTPDRGEVSWTACNLTVFKSWENHVNKHKVHPPKCTNAAHALAFKEQPTYFIRFKIGA